MADSQAQPLMAARPWDPLGRLRSPRCGGTAVGRYCARDTRFGAIAYFRFQTAAFNVTLAWLASPVQSPSCHMIPTQGCAFVARQWCTGSDSMLFIRARYSLPGGGGLGPDFGGSRPVLGSHLGTRMPVGRFVTAAHLHRLGFAPFFFLPVQASSEPTRTA